MMLSIAIMHTAVRFFAHKIFCSFETSFDFLWWFWPTKISLADIPILQNDIEWPEINQVEDQLQEIASWEETPMKSFRKSFKVFANMRVLSCAKLSSQGKTFLAWWAMFGLGYCMVQKGFGVHYPYRLTAFVF